MMPNEPYEEKTYEAALRTTKSPLVKLFNHVELGKNPSEINQPGVVPRSGKLPRVNGRTTCLP
jgi:hypothetical protein